jgi:hypothetical protein
MASGHHGRWGRVTAGKLREEGARCLIAINASKRWKGGEAEQVRPELRRRATGRGRGRKGEEEGEGDADRWRPGVSDSQEKEKGEGKTGRCGEELSGPLGC